jgi:uncharacterized membrane protein YdbT with pleckstrin-like domain
MGYPNNALAPGERLLVHHHPHWRLLAVPVLTLLAATTIAGVLGGLAQSNLDGIARTVAEAAVLVAWAVIVIWRFGIPLVRWSTTHFIVTDRRVLVRYGVLRRSGVDIPLNRISNVQFRHGLMDRILGAGTLIVGSASEGPLEFDDIPYVQSVHMTLYNEVFGSRRDYRHAPGPRY